MNPGSKASAVEAATTSPATITVNVEKLVYGGKGLGFLAGKAIFVPFSAPGDLLDCSVQEEKKKFCRAGIIRIKRPSGLREAPTCTLFGKCGGCQWQHITYSGQTQWKETIFQEILQRQCGFATAHFRKIIPSPSIWGYRSRARFRVRSRRKRPVAGFFTARSHRLVPLNTCPVLSSTVNHIYKLCVDQILPNALDTGLKIKGFTIETADVGGARLILETSARGKRTVPCILHGMQGLEETLRQVSGELELPLAVWISSRNFLEPLGDPPFHGAIPAPVVMPDLSLGAKLELPPQGFSQINLEQNRHLVSIVAEAIKESLQSPAVSVLDLYCGMGNFTIPLAGLCHRITGVDSSLASIKAARRNAARNQTENATFIAEPVEHFLENGHQKGKWDIVLLDPPRSGARHAVEAICRLAPRTVIYVSCDPMTLCRDLKTLLGSGYAPRWSIPVDMFPHTYHIESVTVLDLNRE